jgi:uncharacterized protein YdbL (DUF1318 family)
VAVREISEMQKKSYREMRDNNEISVEKTAKVLDKCDYKIENRADFMSRLNRVDN